MSTDTEEPDYMKSEWNEQQNFSIIYFAIARECRQAQITNDPHKWKASLLAKITHAYGIMSDKEKETMQLLRKKIFKYFSWYQQVPLKVHKEKSRRYGVLIDILHEVEGEVDTLTHKHIPFYREPDKFDIDDF